MEKESSFIMKPKVDFCFKELMGSEVVRQGFIAAVLGILPEMVIETELLPIHLRKEYAEDKRRRMYSDKFEIHIVELPKATESEHEETILLKWARFIHAEAKEELEMIAKTDPYIGKAYEELLRMSADEEKRREYEARQKAILDHNYLMRINWEDGKAEGRVEGKEEGKEEAIKGAVSILEDLGIPSQTIKIKIQEKYNLSEEASELYLKK